MKKQPCGQREPSKQTFYNQSTCRNLLPFKERQLPSCSATESPAVFATEVTTSSSCEVLRTKLTMMYSRSEPCRWRTRTGWKHHGWWLSFHCNKSPNIGKDSAWEDLKWPAERARCPPRWISSGSQRPAPTCNRALGPDFSKVLFLTHKAQFDLM